MSRLPRRPSKIQLLLRGRLAAVATPKQKQKYSEPIIHQRLSSPRSIKVNTRQEKIHEAIPKVKIKNSQPFLSKSVEVKEPDYISTESLPIKSNTPESNVSPTIVSIKLWQWLLGLSLLGLLLFGLYY